MIYHDGVVHNICAYWEEAQSDAQFIAVWKFLN